MKRSIHQLVRRCPLAACVMLLVGVQVLAQHEARETVGRFETVPVYLDAEGQPLAAYQVEITAKQGVVKIVGVEEGEAAVFTGEHFYFDRQAVRNGESDRIILAGFSTADRGRLPTGKFRIATLHVYIEGADDPQFVAELVVAADEQARPASPNVFIKRGNDA